MSKATYLESLIETVDQADLTLYSDQCKKQWAELRELVHQREVWETERTALRPKQRELEQHYKRQLVEGQITGAAARKAARKELDEVEERLQDLEVLLAGWPVFVEKKHARCQESIALEAAAAEARLVAEMESLILPPLEKLARAIPRMRALSREVERWGGRIHLHQPWEAFSRPLGLRQFLQWILNDPTLIQLAEKEAER
jgi:hypothetical protein